MISDQETGVYSVRNRQLCSKKNLADNTEQLGGWWRFGGDSDGEELVKMAGKSARTQFGNVAARRPQGLLGRGSYVPALFPSNTLELESGGQKLLAPYVSSITVIRC